MDDVETRKQAAIDVIGRDGVVIVRPTGEVVAIDLKLGRKKVKASKGSNRKPLPPKAPADLVEGYTVARDLAERRRDTCEEGSTEWKAWQKIVTYCDMMATCRFIDEPETKVNYLPLDERIIDKRTLSTAMAKDELPEWTPYQDMALKASLAMLSEQERVVVQMHYGAQMSRRSIALALEITPGTVDKCISRAQTKWSKVRN